MVTGDYRIQNGGHQMNYTTVYVGMDVHKESFTLCSMTIEDEKASRYQKTEADYKKVLKYLEFLRTIYGDNCNFNMRIYEAGCLGLTPLSSSTYVSACGVCYTHSNYHAGATQQKAY